MGAQRETGCGESDENPLLFPVPVHAPTRRGAAGSRMLRRGVSRGPVESDGQQRTRHA